jgi:ferritin-like metal-binding protein YciE
MSSIPGKAPTVKIPPQVETARDLLLEDLGRLLTIESTLATRVLPLLVHEIKDGELQQAVREHLDETYGHEERVKEAFGALEAEPSGRPALGLDGLVTERESTIPEVATGLRPGVTCAALMGTEHYEINAYEAAIRLADALGAEEVAGLLRANHRQEVAALEKLARHADRLARLAVEEAAIR